MRAGRMALLLFGALGLLVAGFSAAQPLEVAGELKAFDIPSDDGTAIGLSWPVSEAEGQPGPGWGSVGLFGSWNHWRQK